jgi:hypothetical protein
VALIGAAQTKEEAKRTEREMVAVANFILTVGVEEEGGVVQRVWWVGLKECEVRAGSLAVVVKKDEVERTKIWSA